MSIKYCKCKNPKIITQTILNKTFKMCKKCGCEMEPEVVWYHAMTFIDRNGKEEYWVNDKKIK
jgi:hypothetical protein